MEKEKCPMQGRMSQCKEGECHHQPIEEKWKIEKRALDLVCAIFYYGQFRAETPNEKELESILKELGRWPTSESACVQNTKWWEGQKSFIENLLEQERNDFKKILNSGRKMYEIGKKDERKRMSEEIENYFDKAIHAETENGFNADSKKKTKAEVLSIINK